MSQNQPNLCDDPCVFLITKLQEVLSTIITVQFQMQLCHGGEGITEPI